MKKPDDIQNRRIYCSQKTLHGHRKYWINSNKIDYKYIWATFCKLLNGVRMQTITPILQNPSKLSFGFLE